MKTPLQPRCPTENFSDIDKAWLSLVCALDSAEKIRGGSAKHIREMINDAIDLLRPHATEMRRLEQRAYGVPETEESAPMQLQRQIERIKERHFPHVAKFAVVPVAGRTADCLLRRAAAAGDTEASDVIRRNPHLALLDGSVPDIGDPVGSA
jgi:hypothetical protein